MQESPQQDNIHLRIAYYLSEDFPDQTKEKG